MIKHLKHNLMKKSREFKYQQFIYLTNPTKDSTILDVGTADQEYSPYDNYLEKRYPYPHNITGLTIFSSNRFKRKYPNIRIITYSGDKFPLKDKQFQITYSNAVIEHVGDLDKQLFFINEMFRVSNVFYFTTPAKEFPLEIHTNYPFIHWLPKNQFDKLIRLIGKEWASENYMHLLKKRDIEILLKLSQAKEYTIFTHKFGHFPLHYAVLGKG